MAVEILDETRCHLGEGPTYDPAQDKAWWFDIREKRLLEHDFATASTSIHDLPCMGSMLGVVDERTQLIATENGLYIRDTATGALTLHHPLEADNPATRSNDGRVHPSGAIWIGTMSKQEEKGAGAIYWFFKGELRQLYPAISIPNAICFSGDGGTAFFTDTRENKLMTVAVDPANGLPRGEPSLLYDHGSGKGGLDGAVVDAGGAIWVACWGGSCVTVISPLGEVVRTVPLPTLQPSCPAFVDRDLGRLLITSAWQFMDEAQRGADLHAGKTFVLDDVAVRGRAEPRVVL
jgi:sugar lactone lactonase YvrE